MPKINKPPFISILLFVACTITGILQLIHTEEWTYSLIMYQSALAEGEYYRLITNAFIHFSFGHYFSNMLSLLILSINLENNIGHIKYFLCYLIGILGSSLCINFIGGQGMHGGASGAIWCIMGAYMIYAIRNGYNTSGPIKLIILNLIFTFTVPGVSWQGHIGGLIASIFCWPLCKEKTYSSKEHEQLRKQWKRIK